MATVVTPSIDERISRTVWDEKRIWGNENPVQEKIPEPLTFILFGGTGVLAHRKLVPSLYRLMTSSLMPRKFAAASDRGALPLADRKDVAWRSAGPEV